MAGEHPGLPPTADDDSFVPFKGVPYFEYLVPGARLCRIYNHTRGHRCLTFNPTMPAAKGDGGRFDRIIVSDSPVMYGAEAPDVDGGFTALVETLRPLFVDARDGRPQTVALTELQSRSIQFFEVRREIILASLLQDNSLSNMNATAEVCYHGDRAATQQWGHYFQDQLTSEFKGLAYNSTPKTRGRGFSFVLWGKRIADDNFFKPVSGEMCLADEYRKVVTSHLNEVGVQVVAPAR